MIGSTRPPVVRSSSTAGRLAPFSPSTRRPSTARSSSTRHAGRGRGSRRTLGPSRPAATAAAQVEHDDLVRLLVRDPDQPVGHDEVARVTPAARDLGDERDRAPRRVQREHAHGVDAARRHDDQVVHQRAARTAAGAAPDAVRARRAARGGRHVTCVGRQPPASRRPTHSSAASSPATTRVSSATTRWRGPNPGGSTSAGAASREPPVGVQHAAGAPGRCRGRRPAPRPAGCGSRTTWCACGPSCRSGSGPSGADEVNRSSGPVTRPVVVEREGLHRPAPVVGDDDLAPVRAQREVAADRRRPVTRRPSTLRLPSSSSRVQTSIDGAASETLTSQGRCGCGTTQVGEGSGSCPTVT